jgi:hypothetical protein
MQKNITDKRELVYTRRHEIDRPLENPDGELYLTGTDFGLQVVLISKKKARNYEASHRTDILTVRIHVQTWS